LAWNVLVEDVLPIAIGKHGANSTNERKGPKLLSYPHRQLIDRLIRGVYEAFKRRQRWANGFGKK